MKLVAVLIAAVVLVSLLAFAFQAKPARITAVSPAPLDQPAATLTPATLDRAEAQRSRVQLETNPAPGRMAVHDAALAPDGKPWASQVVITGGSEKNTFSVEWVGNTKRLMHDNGQPYSEVAYVNGQREGMERSWYRNGLPHGVENWSEGKREGVSTYFNDAGVLIARGAYSKGYKNGSWEEWYENGVAHSLGTYEASPSRHTQIKVGRWTVWNPDGSIDPNQTGFYENGARVGP